MEYLKSSQEAAGFEYLEQTGSTNRDLLAKAEGLPEFFVLATDYQTAGKGRMERSWEARPGSSVMASVLLRPTFIESSGIGWLSLMAALAISQAIAGLGQNSKIKWPNDVLIKGKKVSGLITEVVGEGVVIGIGVNVGMEENQLPVNTATSLLVEGGKEFTRNKLICDILEEFQEQFIQWDQGIDEIQPLYKQLSATIGTQVRVEYPGGASQHGTAAGVSETGALILDDGTHVQSADVIHLR